LVGSFCMRQWGEVGVGRIGTGAQPLWPTLTAHSRLGIKSAHPLSQMWCRHFTAMRGRCPRIELALLPFDGRFIGVSRVNRAMHGRPVAV
jgi:hypothetical protein